MPQICLLPKTQHDPNSFIVDVCHASVCIMIQYTTGLERFFDTL